MSFDKGRDRCAVAVCKETSFGLSSVDLWRLETASNTGMRLQSGWSFVASRYAGKSNSKFVDSKEISMSDGSILTILEATFPFENWVAIDSGGLRDSPSFLGESLRRTG